MPEPDPDTLNEAYALGRQDTINDIKAIIGRHISRFTNDGIRQTCEHLLMQVDRYEEGPPGRLPKVPRQEANDAQ